jgi:ankyrin repeat protein
MFMSYITRLAPFILAASSLIMPHVASAKNLAFDPMSVEVNNAKVIDSLYIEKLLDGKEESARYISLASMVKAHGEWVTIGSSGLKAKIHITSYLIQTNREQEAVNLIKNKDVGGWLSYSFQGGVFNDFVMALDTGSVNYIKALIESNPNGINTPFTLTAAGDEVTPISLLATDKYIEKDEYEAILRYLLKSGANPHQPLPNGMTPMVIASASNNMKFVRVSQAHISEQTEGKKGLFSNTPLSQSQMIEMQAIVDALIEDQTKNGSKYKFSKLHEIWVQMIIKGYNVAADLIYDRLVSFPQFNVDYRDDGGLSGLMAASLSDIYGGNVEYAKKLIALGAEPQVLIDVKQSQEQKDSVKINLIQLSLSKDNYKVVGLLIVNGVDFLFMPESEEVLILHSAMEQKAFKSAELIRQAIMQSMNEESGS